MGQLSMQQLRADLSATIAQLAACLPVSISNYLISSLYITHCKAPSEISLTRQSIAVTDPPQSWVSHEIHVTSAQLPEQSEHTIARRGVDHDSYDEKQY